MEELQGLLNDMTAGDSAIADGGLVGFLASILLACFVGQAIAWVYQRTHSGLSYSMGFTQSLVTLTLGSALLVRVIGGSIVFAFGLLGALAIVRFRNVLKDTRDTVFVFFALILGMSIGTGRIGVALVGTAAFAAAVGWLHTTSFGAKGRFDGHVTYRLEREGRERASLHVHDVLKAFCRAVQQTSFHDDGVSTEVVCAVHLRDPRRASDLAQLLRTVPGVGDATIVMRDRLTEL